jgi:Tol biopolymer transport system component
LLSAGSRVGPYEILAPLGAGGMGEVYRARDSRLDREVALKVLPPDAASDPERLGRFQREARAVASLNHPHILAVHDVGSEDGVDYVVFELLEGESLRQRLDSGPLPPRKAVDYGVQICRGLAAAHAKGVVHRDLKPENLFLTEGGHVKILDFGLAKRAAPPDGPDQVSKVETRTASTEAGRVMGTAGYMSPEQAQGQPADARSDLFSLGAILYEMLSGRRAFVGRSSADVLAAVLRSDPREIETEGVPSALEGVVRRCLEKDPGERFQTAHDVGLALEALSGEAWSTAASSVHPRPARLATPVAGLVALVAVVAAAAWWLRGHQARPPGGPQRIVPLTADGGYKFAPRLSPDGERVAYTWAGTHSDNWDIYVKAIGQGTRPLRLTDDKANDWAPEWSPDGRQIAFVREQGTRASICTVPSLGGQERRLIDVVGLVRSPTDGSLIPFLSWSPDGEWLAMGEKAGEDEPAHIVRVSLATLEKEPLTFPPADSLGDLQPVLSPDGRQMAFVRAGSRHFGLEDVWVQSVGTRKAHPLTSANHDYCGGLTWTEDGAALVFQVGGEWGDGGQIVRARVDGKDPPVPVAGVGRDVAWPSIRAGRMVHVQLAPAPSDIWRAPARRSTLGGKPEKLIASRWGEEVSAYSPDGRRIAFTSGRSGTWTVWVCDEDGTHALQLTTFESILGGAGTPWSPDGRQIVVVSQESGNWDLYLVNSEGGRPRQLTHEPSADVAGSFSRDGRFIYFSSDRSGRPQVWKMPAEGGPATQITRGGGGFVNESWDGRLIYYSPAAAEIWRMPAGGGEETPVVRVGAGLLAGWDVSRTGIYYAVSRPLELAGEDYAIHFLDFASGRTETLLRKQGDFGHWSLRVSPDERWVLYAENAAAQSDLMLVENFR